MRRLFVVEDESGMLGLLGPSAAGDDQPYAWSKWKTIWRLDLDECERTKPDATDEQQAMHAERMALYWAAEFDRLAPCLGGHPARESETVRMRAVIEAMRPIVEAAQAQERASRLMHAFEFNRVTNAVADNRERLALAMSAWENSQTLTPEERLKANPAMLEPAEWAALFDVRAAAIHPEDDMLLSIRTRRLLVSAIDKLREQAAEVRR